MTSDSASVARLQLWPALSSAVDITAKPSPSAVVGLLVLALTPGTPTVSLVTLGAVPDWCSIPQLAPCVISSLWLNCGCGAQGSQACPGWNRTAIWYWSRSWYPVSTRMMKGTVVPLSVVVAATAPDGGGLAGVDASKGPVAAGLYLFS